MDDREAYMSYVGDCVGQAQEDILSDWIDANRKIIDECKKVLADKDFDKVYNIIKKIGPI